jgi:nucleotide-binding universal stress UspA family protein
MNTPVRTILAATDLSAPSREAVLRAAGLARTTGAHLELVHAVDEGPLEALRQWLGAGSSAESVVVGSERSLLEDLAREVALAGPTAGTHVETGAPVEVIGRRLQAVGADLLVTGARGGGLLRHLVLGSTAERLLRHTHRPVLVVRADPARQYGRALAAVDVAPGAENPLPLLRALAPDAHVWLLHAYEVPFESKLRFAGVADATIRQYRASTQAAAGDALRRLAEAAGLVAGQWTPCLVEGDPSLRILEEAARNACDLVCLGKQDRHRAEELLLGSVTKHVLAEWPGDVLVTASPAVQA